MLRRGSKDDYEGNVNRPRDRFDTPGGVTGQKVV